MSHQEMKSCTAAKTKNMTQHMRTALLIVLEKSEAADQLEYEESFTPEAGSDRPLVFANGRAAPMLSKYREDKLDALEGRIAAAETLSSLADFVTVTSDREKFHQDEIDRELLNFRQQFQNYLDGYEARRPVHNLPGMEKMHNEIMGILQFDGFENTFDIEEYYALDEIADMSIGENVVGAVASFYKHVAQSEATEKMYEDHPDLEPPALPDLSREGSTPEEEESLKRFIKHVEQPLEDLRNKETKINEEIAELIETSSLPMNYDVDYLVKAKKPGKCLEFGPEADMVELSEQVSPLVENLARIRRAIVKTKEDVDERLMLLLLVHRGSRPQVSGNEDALLSEFSRKVEESVTVVRDNQQRKQKLLQDIINMDTTAMDSLSQACARYSEALGCGSSSKPHRMLPVVNGLCSHLDEAMTSAKGQLKLIEKQSTYMEAINASLTQLHDVDQKKSGFSTSKHGKGRDKGNSKASKKSAPRAAADRRDVAGPRAGGQDKQGRGKASKKGAPGAAADYSEAEWPLEGGTESCESIDPVHCRKELEKIFKTTKMTFINFQDELNKGEKFSIPLSPSDGAEVAKWMTLLVQYSLGVSADEMKAKYEPNADEETSWKELKRALRHAKMEYSDVMKNVLRGKRIPAPSGQVVAQSVRVMIARHAMNIVQCKQADSYSRCVMC